MSRAIGVEIDGVVEWHAPPVGPGDYDTLCGLDANDPTIGHTGTVKPSRGQRITCSECHSIWSGIKTLRLKASEFDARATKGGAS